MYSYLLKHCFLQVKKYTGERDYASITSFIRKRLGQEKLIVKALLN